MNIKANIDFKNNERKARDSEFKSISGSPETH